MPDFYSVPKPEAVEFIAHYASEYYDPAKAREYYLRTRELKGRNKAQTEKAPENETKEQRKARQERNKAAQAQARSQRESEARTRDAKSFAKKEIRTRRSADLDSLAATNKARTEAIRKQAEETRARIDAKLKAALSNLSKQKLELNPIPENASPQLKAFLTKQNQRLAASARKGAQKAAESAREEASASMRKLGTDLKSAVAQARANYEKSRDQLKANYEKAEETEMRNIEKNVR